MLTLEQVRQESKKKGTTVTPRSFWRYIELGLIPEGQRYPGMGNVFYFPDDTPARIAQIQTLKKDLGIPLRVIRKSLLYLLDEHPWKATVVRKQPSGIDLLVWFGGTMARLGLVKKTQLEKKDFEALSKEVTKMFVAFGVAISSTAE